MKKGIKITVVALLSLALVIVVIVVHRVFFMFNSDKVKSYAEEIANATGSPDKAYQLIIESCQFIKKSQDLTKQVLLLAEIDHIDKEQALVLTAVNQCYSNGLMERPDTAQNESDE